MVMEEAMFRYSFSKDVASHALCGPRVNTGNGLVDYIFCVVPYRVFMVKNEFDFLEQLWSKTHEFISQPVYKGFEKHQKWEADIMKHPRGFVSAIAFPNMSRFSLIPNISEADQRLANLAAAASAYYAAENAYPLRDRDLTPTYINEIPIDPFDGKPLKMKSVASGLVVYSIGPDFKDNGGTVTYTQPYEEKKSGDIIFRLGAAYDRDFLKPALPQWSANGKLAMVQRALAVGADVNKEAPLVAAATGGHSDVVRLLLENGADVNGMIRVPEKKKRKKKESVYPGVQDRNHVIGGLNALMAASMKCHEQTVELLLENGANPNTANIKGRTALIVAPGIGLLKTGEWIRHELESLHNTRMEIQVLEARIKELKSKTGGLFEKDSDLKALKIAERSLSLARRRFRETETPEMSEARSNAKQAAPGVVTDRAGTVNRLLVSGANVNVKDELGITPLMAAAFESDVATVQVLLENGADLNRKGHFGWTPLISAKANGNHPVEKLLIEKGASLEIKDEAVVERLVYSLKRMKTALRVKR